jgi:hypothetical protein
MGDHDVLDLRVLLERIDPYVLSVASLLVTDTGQVRYGSLLTVFLHGFPFS